MFRFSRINGFIVRNSLKKTILFRKCQLHLRCKNRNNVTVFFKRNCKQTKTLLFIFAPVHFYNAKNISESILTKAKHY